MIIFNDKEYNSFKDLREKQHLVSEYEVTKVCSCWWKTVRKISEQNNIKSYSVIANNKDCIVYDEIIINLLHSIKPIKNNPIPENYIPKKELIKYLGITPKTLNDIEFWCWDFKKHKKSINGKIYYDFSESAKDFYNRKLYKWKHPDRTKCTCWQ